MKDPILEEARARGMADERGLYIAANVFADGKQLGRVWAFLNGTWLYLAELELPAGLGLGIRLIELAGAKLRVRRALVPVTLTIETGQGRFEFRGFHGGQRPAARRYTLKESERRKEKQEKGRAFFLFFFVLTIRSCGPSPRSASGRGP